MNLGCCDDALRCFEVASMSCNCGKTSGGDECKEANHDGLRNESLDPTGLTARRSMTSVTFDRRRARIRHAKRKPRRGLYPPGSTARHLRRMSVSQAPAAEFLSPFCVGVRFLKTIRSLNHLLCIHYEKSRNGDDIGRTAWGAAQGPGMSGVSLPPISGCYDAVPTAEEQSPARIIQPRFHDERDDANDCDENYKKQDLLVVPHAVPRRSQLVPASVRACIRAVYSGSCGWFAVEPVPLAGALSGMATKACLQRIAAEGCLCFLLRRVTAGTFPAPLKLSARVTVWRVEDVRRWIQEQCMRA